MLSDAGAAESSDYESGADDDPSLPGGFAQRNAKINRHWRIYREFGSATFTLPPIPDHAEFKKLA